MKNFTTETIRIVREDGSILEVAPDPKGPARCEWPASPGCNYYESDEWWRSGGASFPSAWASEPPSIIGLPEEEPEVPILIVSVDVALAATYRRDLHVAVPTEDGAGHRLLAIHPRHEVEVGTLYGTHAIERYFGNRHIAIAIGDSPEESARSWVDGLDPDYPVAASFEIVEDVNRGERWLRYVSSSEQTRVDVHWRPDGYPHARVSASGGIDPLVPAFQVERVEEELRQVESPELESPGVGIAGVKLDEAAS